MGRRTWGVSGLAIVATLLLLAPLASATSPPFTATPSYAPYGGLHFQGHSVVSAVGTGSNKIPVAPAFFLATGIDRQSQASQAIRSGTYAVEVYSGVQNISFTCGPNCPTGNRTVSVDWNVTWSVRENSTCTGNASSTTVLAGVGMAILASVVDESTVTVAGSKLLTLFDHDLLNHGVVTDGKSKHNYLIKFPATLTSGNWYTVVTYFEVLTWAGANSPAGAVCASTASASEGLAAHTVLEFVKVH